jgi:hypothetical protein
MGSWETIFVVGVMLFLAFAMRMVPNEQRIAIFRRGRYLGLKGPGMVMVMPVLDQECKIRIGEHGELAAGGMGKFREFLLPVIIHADAKPGAALRVTGFTKDALQVTTP